MEPRPRSRTRRDRAPLLPPAVTWRGGVRLGDTIVHCDAGRARDLMFLSHAHVAVRGAHGKVIASPRTLALREARGLPAIAAALPVAFGRPLSLGPLRLELYPSGHVPGAASLLVVEPSGRRIAYAGDINPRSHLGEPGEVRGADVLVLEAPLALTATPLPPRAESHARLLDEVRRALDAGRTPILLAPALGVAQEVELLLAAARIPTRLHPTIAAWSRACQSVGIPLPAPVTTPPRRRNPKLPAALGLPLLWPIDLANSPLLARAANPYRVALSGHALDPHFAARVHADLAIPLTDHADLPTLVDYVRHAEAREVYVTAGFGPALVDALAKIGVVARPLGAPRQMEMGL